MAAARRSGHVVRLIQKAAPKRIAPIVGAGEDGAAVILLAPPT
jgi:hypothetical protein